MLAGSTAALLIVAAAIVLYATEKFPLSVTTILAMLAMVYTGVLTPAQAFSGFASTATLLLIGIAILGEAVLSSGLSGSIGRALAAFSHMKTGRFATLTFVFAAALAAFLNGLIVMAVLTPVLDALARSTPRLARRFTYFPLAAGAAVGGSLTTIGSASMLNASNLLAQSWYGARLGVLEPALVTMPAALAVLAFYALAGQRLQEKTFRFAETPLPEAPPAEGTGQRHKRVLTALILLGCIAGFLSGADLALVAFTGAAAVLITGCIDTRRAYAGIGWETIIVVSGSIGFAKGIEVSGAGKLLAGDITTLCAPLAHTPFGICAVVLILSTILGNFMSNNAAVTIVAPIALAVAAELSYDPAPLVLACGVGANLAVATPVSAIYMTMISPLGYRFRDILRLGGCINLIAIAVVLVSFYLVFYR